MRRKPLTWAKTWVEPIICTHWWISQSHLLRYFPETGYFTFHLRFIINLNLCFFFNNLFRAVSIVSPGSSNPPGNPNLPSNLNKALPLFVCLKMVLPKMHVYEGIVRMLTPKFFFSPATIDNKKTIQNQADHLAKNMAWAAHLYFSSPGGWKSFSTSTQSSSIPLKALPGLHILDLADLKRGKDLCILGESLPLEVFSLFLLEIEILYKSIVCYCAAECFSVFCR